MWLRDCRARGLHRARHSLRKSRSPDHDSLHAAERGVGRAARADAHRVRSVAGFAVVRERSAEAHGVLARAVGDPIHAAHVGPVVELDGSVE